MKAKEIMSERQKIGYRYFYGCCIGVCIFIMVFTSNYIGIYYLSRLIVSLVIIIASTYLIKITAVALTDYIETQPRQKKEEWKFITHLILSFILLLIYYNLAYNLGYIPVYFHEIGHLLTAISFKAEVVGVFLSPLEGMTFINAENLLDIQQTIVASAGGLGVISFGTILLLLLHWNKEISFLYYFPLSVMILGSVGSDLWYFFNGAMTLTEDMGQIIQLNPDLNQWAISYFSLFGMGILIMFWIWSIIKRARFMKDSFEK